MAFKFSVTVISASLMLLLTSATVSCQTSPAYSAELVNFVAVISRTYENSKQVEADTRTQAGNNVHPKLLLNGRAVEIPALLPLVTVYMDEYYNEQLTRKVIGIVSENSEGEFVISFHNVTVPRKYNIDTTDYSNFESGDISEAPLCEAVLEQVAPTVPAYTGDCDCFLPAINDYVTFAMTYTCTSHISVPTGRTSEQHKTVPYRLTQTGNYPLPDYLLIGQENFVDPCGNQ